MRFKYLVLIGAGFGLLGLAGCGNEGKLLGAKEGGAPVAKAERRLVEVGCFFKYEETDVDGHTETTVTSLDCADGVANSQERDEMRKAVKAFILAVFSSTGTTNEMDLAGLMKAKVMVAKKEFQRLSGGEPH